MGSPRAAKRLINRKKHKAKTYGETACRQARGLFKEPPRPIPELRGYKDHRK